MLVWDSDAYEAGTDISEVHARILDEISMFLAKGYTMYFSYSPSRTGSWEGVTFEWIQGDMDCIEEYERQE